MRATLLIVATMLSTLAYRANMRELYIQPTKSASNLANISCPILTSYDCYTLNEWIESGSNPFTDDTTVALLPGEHLITSIKKRVIIENVTSLAIAGQPGETVITCLHGTSFEFYSVVNVGIHFIEFESCTIESRSIFTVLQYPLMDSMSLTLLFVEAQDVLVRGVVIKNGGIIVMESVNGSTFIIRDSEIISDERGFYYSSFIHLKCMDGIPLEIVHIIDSCTTIKVITSPCTRVNLRRVLISHFNHYDFALSVHSTLWIVLTDVVFQNNTSPLMNVNASSVDFTGNFIVSSNTDDGVRVSKGHVIIHPGSHFNICDNHFKTIGLNLLDCASINIGNKEDTVVIYFHKNFINKSGIFTIINTRGRIINVNVSFTNNTSIGFDDKLGHAGILLLQRSIIEMNDSSIRFVANRSPLSGGLTMISTELDVTNISGEFAGNHGSDGGGLSLYERSFIVFVYYSFLTFYHNTASRKGGAIFVEDSDYINSHTKISKNLRALLFLGGSRVDMILSDDRATVAGNEVYGGWIDILEYGRAYNISHSGSDLSVVASNPTRVCLCNNSIPDCNTLKHHVAVYPGEMFEIEAVAVGQRMGVVPSIIIADLRDKSLLFEGQDVQSVGRECTTLRYRLRSLRSSEAVILRAQDIGTPKLNVELEKALPSRYHVLFKQMSITAVLKSCPIGFEHDKYLRECVCSQMINIHSSINCNFSSYSITRTAGIWLSAKDKVNTSYSIVIHDHCPYDYCRTDIDSLNINLESSDKQCAYDRSGVLCGACKVNYSQVFGTARCKVCLQTMLPVILLASVVAGIVLVGFLMVLNLTVSKGHINGIIFYANVIRISQTVFFSSLEDDSTFLTTFIAWLNLDLGIETCFYDGLDAYAKTWLQFAFPLYVWLMVVAIIVASHYSTIASKIFGNNGLQVLATLFLLSYAKILRIIVTVFSYSVLYYSDGSVEKVWLYDGNIKFLEGKHVLLFIICLIILVVLSVFYTLPLVTIQWLQRISHYKILCWVHKLIPLFDAYTGPYKFKHRYWTGILLLVRVAFLLIFSLNVSNNPAINLLAIAIITFTLLVYISYVQVYKNWMYNILEMSALFNLALLSVVTLYQMAMEEKIIFTTNLSAGINLCTLFLIVVHHAIKQLLSLRKVKYIFRLVKVTTKLGKKEGYGIDDIEEADNEENNQHKGLTHTSIELCEPLVEQ